MTRALTVLAGLTLALLCCAEIQAAKIVIDSFDDAVAHTTPPTPSVVATSSAIGDTRVLTSDGTSGAVVAGGVITAGGGAAGGTVTSIYLDGGTLGMADLTDGGTNTNINFDVVAVAGTSADVFALTVVDSAGGASVFAAPADAVSVGANVVPIVAFAELTPGGADFSSVELITKSFAFTTPDAAIILNEIAAIPEPASLTLCLLLACMCCSVRRRRMR